MAGAFQTTRDIFDNPIWLNIVEFRLFFLIYGKAAFTDGVRVGNIELKRGQWVRSYRNLQRDLEYIENHAIKQYSLSTIKRAIDNLVKQERITVEPCELGTLFTVVNYDKYQCLVNYKSEHETENEQRKNRERTEKEQMENNNNNANNANNANINNIMSVSFSDQVKEIIDYLNEKAGTAYKPTTRKTRDLIKARMNEHFTVDDFKKVIDIKVSDWNHEPLPGEKDMRPYLRPVTLFGTKFESYLNSRPAIRVQTQRKEPQYYDFTGIAKRLGQS